MADLTGYKKNSFVNTFFHSFSQVVILENVISGLLILIAIAVYDYNMAILAALGAIIGNIFAVYLTKDYDSVEAGLFGFCPVLIGAAAGLFISSFDAYIVTVLGSLLSVPLTIVVNNLCARINVPGFTLPFILITWLFILVSFNSNLIHSGRTTQLAEALAANGTMNLVFPDALLKGLGEIFLLDSVISSALILVAFLVAKWQLGFGVVGSILLSLGLGFVLKVDPGTLSMGLFTYNSILTFMAVETFSKTKGAQKALHVLIGIIFTFLLDLAIPVMLSPLGLPTLTISFVVASWGLLYLEQFVTIKE